MGKLRHPLALVSVLLVLGAAHARAEESALQDRALPRPGLPILFTPNQGQCSPEVLFQARVPGLVASLLADGLHLDVGGAGLRLRFVGATGARAEGADPRPARVHFLDGSRSTGALATFGSVRLAGLYPGIDFVVREQDGHLEYDLLLAPGANAQALELELLGAEGVAIDASGALCAGLGGATLRQLAPLAWQVGARGERTPLACSWRALAGGCFGFELAQPCGGARLVIDPVLVYSSYVGGSNADAASSVFLDEEGAAYVTGWARSPDFPVTSGAASGARGQEAVVFKLAPGGRELVYASYIGGHGDDQGMAIRVSPEGEAIVAGTTRSDDFPTTDNVLEREHSGGTDTFVLKLSADGAAIVFATLLGGSGEDQLAGLALGAGGEITVAGTTRSRDFPISSWSFSAGRRGGRDVFVTRLDPLGERLLFSTRLGGSDDDEARGLALDDEGCPYVTGQTQSHDFPTTLGALDRERCGTDAFVLKLSGGGRTLLYSTFLGGSQQDEGMAIAVDAQRRAVVVGWTQSLDFPFAGATPGGRKDAFVARLGEMGNVLVHATPLGGTGADEGLGVALDPLGAAWVVGRTRSRDLAVTRDAYQGSLTGAADAFLAQVSLEDGRVLYATYLGGEGEDELCGVHCDRSGTGLGLCGASSDIPAARRGALSGRHRGPSDAFVLCIDPRSSGPSTPGVVHSGIGLGF